LRISTAEEYAACLVGARPAPRVVASAGALTVQTTPASTNFEKFQTSNPVVRRLIDRFYARLGAIVDEIGPASALDAGCGEGETLARLGASLPERISAVDISPEAVDFTARRFPQADVRCESVYELPFEDGSFELVICLEVLEHLGDPLAALGELSRVSSSEIVLSVPHEPWFRGGSLLRGKYVRTLGNHPEHINHWSARTLGALLSTRYEAVRVERSFPWLIARFRVR
jgi:2-polyprenyl-3-methyl-5-hydroxy-6-metoxy-1,4-benzoquinol methylase